MIINIEDDFDLQRIADSGQCFRWKALPSGEYRILNGADCLYIKSRGDTCYDVSCDAAEWEDRWHEYFDFDLNYSSIRAGINPCEDSFLWRASQEEKGIRILRQDPWEMLITFIISQNKNIPAIRQSVELLCERHGERKIDCRGCITSKTLMITVSERIRSLLFHPLRGGQSPAYRGTKFSDVPGYSQEQSATRCRPLGRSLDRYPPR